MNEATTGMSWEMLSLLIAATLNAGTVVGLAALGLPFDATRAGESVRAELLVRPSGQVLAVRFLQ